MKSIRDYLDLAESFEDYEDDEDVETNFDHLKSSDAIKLLIPTIVKATQNEYDKWEIVDGDEIGFQDEYAGGGICHLIADKICDILNNAGITCTTVSSNHEQHVYCVAQCSDGVFEIDVPYRNYETGGGFTWEKIPGVIFDPRYISISQLDSNPGKMNQYVDEWEDY